MKDEGKKRISSYLILSCPILFFLSGRKIFVKAMEKKAVGVASNRFTNGQGFLIFLRTALFTNI